eukprot:g967.t1
MLALYVKEPSAHKDRAVVASWSHAGKQGRGRGLKLGPQSGAVFFKKTKEGALVVADDPKLFLEVANRKFETSTKVCLWSVNPKWPCRFIFNADSTISPAKNPKVALGIVNSNELGLVQRTSAMRFYTTQGSDASAMKRLMERTSKMNIESLADKGTPQYLLVTDGGGGKSICRFPAVCLHGKMYQVAPNPAKNQLGGRGHALKIASSDRAVAFLFDGPRDNFTIRKVDDQDLALEINYGNWKMSVGTRLSLWSTKGHREWAKKYTWRANNSISPAESPSQALGVRKSSGDALVLVPFGSSDAIVFGRGDAMKSHAERIQREIAERQAVIGQMRKRATAFCSDPKVRTSLIERGFVRVPGAVSADLVDAARREVNRQIGQSHKSADVFKAKTFSPETDITNLFNESMIPFLLKGLLGDSHYRQSAGQIALRFPGDMCEKGTCVAGRDHFEGVRKYWHIDGLASGFIKGVTDHFGHIHNFDALVGVLLSDVPAEMSGELCVYPGSHHELAAFFQREGTDRIAKKGNEALPTGDKTDSVLRRRPVHCLGKKGDVFIANYMTAHFIAPNASPNIRYAIYFRVKGPSFGHPTNVASMVQPLKNWFPKVSSSASSSASTKSYDEAMQGESRDEDSAGYANNDHTIPESLRGGS